MEPAPSAEKRIVTPADKRGKTYSIKHSLTSAGKRTQIHDWMEFCFALDLVVAHCTSFCQF